MRVVTLNVNGLRAALRKGFLAELAAWQADIVCLQEVRAEASDLPKIFALNGWHVALHSAAKKGYSGVMILSKVAPLFYEQTGFGEEFDTEGRYLMAHWPDFSVASLYLPSGSSGEDRQAAKFRFLAAFQPQLDAWRASNRPCILCGDWNIAHQNIDLKNWKGNLKNSGFTPEERAWLGAVLNAGWTDAWRTLYPDQAGYTWWSQRGNAFANDVGWRIDYQLCLNLQPLQASVVKTPRLSDHAALWVAYQLTPPPH